MSSWISGKVEIVNTNAGGYKKRKFKVARFIELYGKSRNLEFACFINFSGIGAVIVFYNLSTITVNALIRLLFSAFGLPRTLSLPRWNHLSCDLCPSLWYQWSDVSEQMSSWKSGKVQVKGL